MTLDEAIEHARDKANEQNYYASFERGKHIQSCKKCAEEHEQLVSWLEELKELREFKAIYQKGMDYSYATFMYNKAIDDLTNKLTSDEFQKYNLDFVFETSKSLSYNECISAFCEYIEEIANELKECAE